MMLHEAFRALDSATRQAVLEATDEYCLGVFPVIHALRSHVPIAALAEHLRSATAMGSYTLKKLVMDDLTGPEIGCSAVLDEDLDPRDPENVVDLLSLLQRGKLRRELPDELLRLDKEGLLEIPRAATRTGLSKVLHTPGLAKELYEEGIGYHPLSIVLVHVQLMKHKEDRLGLWDFIAALKELELDWFSDSGKSMRLRKIGENMNAYTLDPDIVYSEGDIINLGRRFSHITKKLMDDFGPYVINATEEI